MLRFIVAGSIAFSTAAAAQFQPIQQVDVAGAMRQAERARNARDAAQADRALTDASTATAESLKSQQAAQEEHRAQDIVVGRLIAANRCTEARGLALNEGRFDLVDRVTSLCTAAPTP